MSDFLLDSHRLGLISHLEAAQAEQPDNLIIAHDLGLAHYVQAQSAEPEAAYGHWEQVIAQWVPVLESDAYWEDFCDQRSAVYNQGRAAPHVNALTEADNRKTRQRLHEKLSRKIESLPLQYSDSSVLFDRLSALLHVEIDAVRLVQQMLGITLRGYPCLCGPLLARQLDPQGRAVKAFFKSLPPLKAPHPEESLAVILRPIQQADIPDASLRSLYACFSELGPAAALLEHQQAAKARAVLAQLRCPHCADQMPLFAKEIAADLPSQCIAPCDHFEAHNPSYATLQDEKKADDGYEVYFRHAIELAASIQVALAFEAAHTSPAVGSDVQGYVQRAVLFAQIHALGGPLKVRLAEELRGWALQLKDTEGRRDDAITLLEVAGEFAEDDQWKGNLAELLNQRGVEAYERQEWDLVRKDLSYAYRLNRFSQGIRDNLLNFLERYHAIAQSARKYALVNSLSRDLQRVKQGQDLAEEDSSDTVVEIDQLQRVLPPDQIVDPVLFDQYGNLKLDVLDQSADKVLRSAQEAAAALLLNHIQLPVLLLAMMQDEFSWFRRLLAQQNIDLDRVDEIAQSELTGFNKSDSYHPGRNTYLNQDHFQVEARHVLRVAWSMAGYDPARKINDRYLLAALLVRPLIIVILEDAGVDIIAMNAQLLEG